MNGLGPMILVTKIGHSAELSFEKDVFIDRTTTE